MTYPLLENAPAHDQPEFIDYLRDNNVVVEENPYWIVIENCKYHTAKQTWHTAFWKHPESMRNSAEFEMTFGRLINGYITWEWLKKSPIRQTIQRFHIHFILKKS